MQKPYFLACQVRICKLILIIILLPNFFSELKSQGLFELQWSKGNIEYKGLLVYMNDKKKYMRVSFSKNDAQRLINVNYIENIASYESVYYAALVGESKQIIKAPFSKNEEFNPPHFFWELNQDNSLSLHPPYFSETLFPSGMSRFQNSKAKSFRTLSKGSISSEFLKQFFNTNEQDFIFLNEIYSSKEEKPFPINSVMLHLIVVANTKIDDIGQGCRVGQQKIIKELKEISTSLEIKMKTTVINEYSFTKSRTLNALTNLNPKPNDIVFFYYTGHGYRKKNQVSKFPLLDLRYSSYQQIEKNFISLEYIFELIKKKGARLNLVIGQACNSLPRSTRTESMVPLSYLAKLSSNYPNASLSKLKRLFIKAKGDLLVTPASPFENAYIIIVENKEDNENKASIFLDNFLPSLKREINSFRHEDSADWEEIIETTFRGARNRTSPTRCGDCENIQNGIYLSDIVY